MPGSQEGIAAASIYDKSDSSLLSRSEVTSSYGSAQNFMHSYGLSPSSPADCAEARSISQAMKSNSK
jgi:hypothetical protein